MTTTTSTAASRVAEADRSLGMTLIQGVALIGLGLLLLTAPELSLITLVDFLGIYWLVSGILEIVSIVHDRSDWFFKAIGGAVGIIAGVAIIQHPLWSALLVPAGLVVLLGVLGFILGATDVIRGVTEHHWGAVLLGAVSMVIGAILVFEPLRVSLTLPVVIGAVALGAGIASLIAAFAEHRGVENEVLAPPGVPTE